MELTASEVAEILPPLEQVRVQQPDLHRAGKGVAPPSHAEPPSYTRLPEATVAHDDRNDRHNPSAPDSSGRNLWRRRAPRHAAAHKHLQL